MYLPMPACRQHTCTAISCLIPWLLVHGWWCCWTSGTPPITALALTPDGKAYVVGSQSGLAIQACSSHQKLGELSTELTHVHDLKFSPDGAQLLAVGGTPAESGRIERWPWPAGDKLEDRTLGTEVIYRVCWSSDGKKFAVANGDGTCQILNTSTQEPQIYRGHSGGVLALSFWPDNEKILSAGIDQTIQLWSCATLSRERGLNNHLDTINDLALQPIAVESTKPLLVASVSEDRTVRLWQPSIGRLVRFTRLDSVPRCVRWIQRDAGDDELVVGCDNGRVILLRASDMAILQSLTCNIRPIYELAIMPDRKQLLVGGEGGIQQLNFVP